MNNFEDKTTLRFIARGMVALSKKSNKTLQECASLCAYESVRDAVQSRRLPLSCLTANCFQSATVSCLEALKNYDESKGGSLDAYLRPRAIGAALREASKDRRAGMTGDMDSPAAFEDIDDEDIDFKNKLIAKESDGMFSAHKGAEMSQINEAVKHLPTTCRDIIERLHGLSGRRQQSARQIAKDFGGISHTQVLRIARTGYSRLRRGMFQNDENR